MNLDNAGPIWGTSATAPSASLYSGETPASRSGLDHFGFDVKDTKTVLDRMTKSFPDILIKNDLGDVVPFASVRIQDPVGVHIDVSQEGASNVREGYAQERWDQPRHFNHIALRALKP